MIRTCRSIQASARRNHPFFLVLPPPFFLLILLLVLSTCFSLSTALFAFSLSPEAADPSPPVTPPYCNFHLASLAQWPDPFVVSCIEGLSPAKQPPDALWKQRRHSERRTVELKLSLERVTRCSGSRSQTELNTLVSSLWISLRLGAN